MSLLHAQAHLVHRLSQQSTTALAYLFSWLDPCHLLDDSDTEESLYDQLDDLSLGLSVARRCFPALYAEALAALHSGQAAALVEDLLLAALNHHLVEPLSDLESIRYGVPFAAYGLDFNTEEPLPAEIQLIVQWLTGDETLTTPTPDSAGLAEQVIDSLPTAGLNAAAQDVAAFLSWVWGRSGNTLLDYSQEDLYEMSLDFLDWTPEQIQHLNDCQREANALYAAAQQGLLLLTTQADWQHAFIINCQVLRERKTEHVIPWPTGLIGGAADAANLAVELLPLRDHLTSSG